MKGAWAEWFNDGCYWLASHHIEKQEWMCIVLSAFSLHVKCLHTRFTCERNIKFIITQSLGSVCSIWAVIQCVMTSAYCSWPFVMLRGQLGKSDKSFMNKCHEISSDTANYWKSLPLEKQDSIVRSVWDWTSHFLLKSPPCIFTHYSHCHICFA